MKLIQIILISSLAVLCQYVPSFAAYQQEPANSMSADELVWKKDLGEALAEAKSSRKFVLTDIYTDWCGWCKELDRTTFIDKKFVGYVNDNFLPVKLNAEDRGQGAETAKLNQVDSYPCALIFAPNGQVIGRIDGYLSAKQYKKRLAGIVKKSHIQ